MNTAVFAPRLLVYRTTRPGARSTTGPSTAFHGKPAFLGAADVSTERGGMERALEIPR